MMKKEIKTIDDLLKAYKEFAADLKTDDHEANAGFFIEVLFDCNDQYIVDKDKLLTEFLQELLDAI